MVFWRFGLLAVLGLLLTLGSVSTVPLENKGRISKHPLVIVVSYDGFRYDYVNKVSMPTFDALKAGGVFAPFILSTFPTKTFPNHQSIATGLFPESHGIVDDIVFDPLYNKALSGYNDNPEFWNYRDDVLPIWLRNEMAGEGRVSGVLMWPGSSVPYGANKDILPTYYHPGYDASLPWEKRVDIVMSWITSVSKPANLVFLYHDEPDSSGHYFGPNGCRTLEQVAEADARTAYLIKRLKRANIFHKTNLIILSDHGMMGVTQERISHLKGRIDQSLIKGLYGSSPNFQFLANAGKEQELYESLRLFCATNKCSAWKKGELGGGPYHYAASRRILDVTLVADPGYAFDDFEYTIKAYNVQINMMENPKREYGVHGYINTHPSMLPIFLAHGPAFKKGTEISPFLNVDILPLLCNILKISEPPNNGSLTRAMQMLNRNIYHNSAN